jgi:hypothetical protein
VKARTNRQKVAKAKRRKLLKRSSVTGGWNYPLTWTRLLYIFSAWNPGLAVLFNDYARMVEPFRRAPQTPHRLARTYETLFFFARLRPRVSFAIGAALRALQLTTAFQYVFDPTSGVGFGLNIICLFARSRWPATIVFGWSITKPMWTLLGARPPSGLPVPISISMRKEKSPPAKPKPK